MKIWINRFDLSVKKLKFWLVPFTFNLIKIGFRLAIIKFNTIWRMFINKLGKFIGNILNKRYAVLICIPFMNRYSQLFIIQCLALTLKMNIRSNSVFVLFFLSIISKSLFSPFIVGNRLLNAIYRSLNIIKEPFNIFDCIPKTVKGIGV